MTVYANDPGRTTNAQAILDLVQLGFLREEDSVLDLSVGPKAGFWTKWRPKELHTNDTDQEVEADTRWDARDSTHFPPDSFDVVVWDPPYGYRGTSRLESDKSYGLTKYNSADAIDRLLIDGTRTAMWAAKRLALVKCQDQNVASKFRDQSGFVTEYVRSVGARVAGKLYVAAVREQPAGKKQLNIWGYHSVLLVIEVA